MRTIAGGEVTLYKKHADSIASFDISVPLTETEHLAVDRLIQQSEVIGLGEMTHGSSELVRARFRLLRHLVMEQDVTMIALETEFSRTRSLNDFVLHAIGDAETALSATGSFLAANKESAAFVTWLSGFNAKLVDPSKRVQVFGVDMQ